MSDTEAVEDAEEELLREAPRDVVVGAGLGDAEERGVVALGVEEPEDRCG